MFYPSSSVALPRSADGGGVNYFDVALIRMRSPSPAYMGIKYSCSQVRYSSGCGIDQFNFKMFAPWRWRLNAFTLTSDVLLLVLRCTLGRAPYSSQALEYGIRRTARALRKLDAEM